MAIACPDAAELAVLDTGQMRTAGAIRGMVACARNRNSRVRRNVSAGYIVYA